MRLDPNVLVLYVIYKDRVGQISQKLRSLEVIRAIVELQLDRLVNLSQAILKSKLLLLCTYLEVDSQRVMFAPIGGVKSVDDSCSV